MSRSWMATGLAAMLAVLPASGALAAETGDKAMVTVSGSLQYVTDLDSPHYEVDDYYLVFSDSNQLASIAPESTVVVTGEPITGPSVMMHKALRVVKIVVKPGSAPSGGVSQGQKAPGGGTVTIPVLPQPQTPPPSSSGNSGSSGKVTIPVLPAPQSPPPTNNGNGGGVPPAAPGSGTVTIPVITGPEEQTPQPVMQKVPAPVQLMGSHLVLLFGRLEAAGGQYYINSQRAGGSVRYLVTGDAVMLAGLTGKQIGATATKEVLSDNTIRYHIQSALVLTQDLGTRLISQGGLIYIAPPGQITIQLRGRLVQMDQAPIVGNGRTLIPLRALSESLGAIVAWDQQTLTAHVSLGDRQVDVTVGSNVAVVRQGTTTREVEMDIAPVLVNNRTLVPTRLIAESLGLNVNWDENTRTVRIQ